MNTETKLPFRLKALLTSVYLSILIISLYLMSLFYAMAVTRTLPYGPIFILLSIMILLFVHTLTIFYFIKRVYPSGEIPKPHLIAYSISDIIVILLLLFSVAGAIGIIITLDEPYGFGKTWHTVVGKIVTLALGFLLLAQLHMVIESRSLLKEIRANQRTELLESI